MPEPIEALLRMFSNEKPPPSARMSDYFKRQMDAIIAKENADPVAFQKAVVAWAKRVRERMP